MTIFRTKDSITATVSAIIAIIALVSSFYDTDPEVYLFPRIASVIIAILSAFLLFKVFINRADAIVLKEPIFKWKALWPALLIGFIYLLSLETIGFYVSSFIAYFTLCVVYGKCEMTDLKRGMFKLGVSTIFMIVLFVLFWNLLHVRTPTGLLI